LLTNPDERILDAALAVDFAFSSRFYTSLRLVAGMPPVTWADLHRPQRLVSAG
jgi:methylphosphotriester-DNA--protein-cysteine methyltransferase